MKGECRLKMIIVELSKVKNALSANKEKSRQEAIY